MSDEENPPRPVCLIPHCDEPAESDACCTGTGARHYLCDSCFCGYASSQLDAMGAFECERTANGIVSARGELPCYLFLTTPSECDCARIPEATMARVLSTNTATSEAYQSAKRRIRRAEFDEERAEAGGNDEEDDNDGASNALERLHQVVVDALSRGGYVPCPQCGRRGQKNDACMHMQCPSCGTRYCYCCGRHRGNNATSCKSDESGCDYPSPYLELHPGWGEFNLNQNESARMGALHEFHRRRMAFFLRQVKTHYPNKLWRKLRRQYPDLLNNTPTDGRSIEWSEIDTAEPPLFGRTTSLQLQWLEDGILDEGERERARRTRRQANIVDAEEGHEAATHRPFLIRQQVILLVIWLFSLVITVSLVGFRAVSDSQALRIAGNVFIATLVGTGMPIVAMVHVEYYADHPAHHDWSGVLCFRGINNERPYLARGGSWSRIRVLYWYCYFCGIAFTSIFLVYRHIPFLLFFGSFLLSLIVLSYRGISMLANAAQIPEGTPLPCFLKFAMARFCMFATIFSLGIGFLVTFDEYNKQIVAGTVLLVCGLAGMLAEWIAAAGSDSGLPTSQYVGMLFCNYFGWFGLALGGLLLAFTDISFANFIGIIVFSFLALSFLAFVRACCRR